MNDKFSLRDYPLKAASLYVSALSFILENTIGWIKPLLNVMFASGLDCVNYQMNQVIGNRYVRIQSQLKLASADMDNITSKNIKSLQQEAKAMIEDNQELIDKFCDVLS